jgi:pentatricopeptide repeat protein
MRDKGMSINLITYNAAITALSKAARQRNQRNADNRGKSDGHLDTQDGDLWYLALLLLKQMKDAGIEPDGFCYSSAISCLGAQGRWTEALHLIDVMKKGGPRTRPNKIAYTAAISKSVILISLLLANN